MSPTRTHHNGTDATLNKNRLEAIIIVGGKEETKPVTTKLGKVVKGMMHKLLYPFIFRIHNRGVNHAIIASAKQCTFEKTSSHLLCYPITNHHLNISRPSPKEVPLA